MGRRWTWLALSMLAVFAVSMVVVLIFAVANGTFQQDAVSQVLLFLGFTAFMAVGALIVIHRPGNAIGWIFSATALLAVTGQLADQYAIYAYATRPGSLPGATLAALYGYLPWWLVDALTLVFTPLLFPTGRLLSPRWRPVAWLAGVTTAVLTTLTCLQTEVEVAGQVVANPIGVAAVGNHPEESPVAPALLILLPVLAVAAFGSLLLRFRRSHGVERQQLKWFAYAGALMLLVPLVTVLLPSHAELPWVVVIALPIAAGIAILRYRLYDIDRLINRTLVYGLLSALLAGVYAGAVLVLGQVFGGVGRDPPSWVVAGATLAVAALFQPARRRIQQAVDRRFNRRKYNTAKTIEAFSTRLRDQIDLDTLSTEVLAVVDQTMEPTRVSLWLRPSPDGSSGTPRRETRPTTWAY